MKRSLFLVLILKTIFIFADVDPETSLPVNCSSVQLGAICDCDYASLRLSCRNVTNTDSVPLALEHLFTLTHTHYWNHLQVHCLGNETAINRQLLSGKIKFTSLTLVGNCTGHLAEVAGPKGHAICDDEIQKLSIRENTEHLANGSEPNSSLLLRPIQWLTRLTELTIRESRFTDNAIRKEFSNAFIFQNCFEITDCPVGHPLLKLTISWCNVSHIDSGAFRYLLTLEMLDLSYNQLSHLSGPLFQSLNQYDGREEWERIPRSIFSKLRILNLAHNQLTSLDPGFFDDLSQLREVNLSFNHLTTLPSFTPSSTFFQVFHLGDNPWQCRCSMTWILGAPTFAHIPADKAICASPDYVRDKPLIEGLTVVNSTSC